MDERPGRGGADGAVARRTVLRAGAAVAGQTTGVASVASGQETGTHDTPLTTRAGMREPEEVGRELLGFWIHLATDLDPYEASVADRCAEIPWSDQEAKAFEAVLLDRKADPEEFSVTVFLHDAVQVGPLATDLGEGEETTGGIGPGLDLSATVAGLLGAGWLACRLDDREE